MTFGDWVSVIWAATSPESGYFSVVERRSEAGDLSASFSQLRSRGQGYLQVRLPESDYPLLTLGFRGDHAVVHVFSDVETVSLLVGDGTAPPGTVVDVPIMDEPADFTGDIVLNVDHAWACVCTFIQTGDPSDLGQWRTL